MPLSFELNKAEIRRYHRAVHEHRAAEAGPDEPVAVAATDEELKAAAGANPGRSGAVASTNGEIKAAAGGAPADDLAAKRQFSLRTAASRRRVLRLVLGKYANCDHLHPSRPN